MNELYPGPSCDFMPLLMYLHGDLLSVRYSGWFLPDIIY